MAVPPSFKSHRTLLSLVVGMILFMVGLSFAAVPLYRIFCQKTGYGGTTGVATTLPSRVSDRVLTIRFSSHVDPHLPWAFVPLQKELRVRAGEKALAFYHVRNTSPRLLKGMATYNVTPDKAGPYFQKIECFCFVEQRLTPYQSMDMPLVFFIDPAIDQDPNLQEVETLTLSYTFFPFQGGKEN